MRRLLRRCAVTLAVLLGLGVVAAAIPIAHVELSCRGDAPTAPRAKPAVADAGYTRAEGDSYMTYPEWYIVHAYADLAGVTRRSSESRFDYTASIGTFWSSLCSATRTAGSIGPVTSDQRITDYIIGVSFSLEMAVQGAYERTIGAATAWLRGDAKVPEDAFNQRFLDDYAAFLQQTPWYRYPFKDELVRFWRETPWTWQAPLRSAERRFALSLEYGVKGLYAVAIGALAGYAPADLTIMSVVQGPHATEVEGVTPVHALGDDRQLVRTPRYEAYTTILKAWAANGTRVREIAGNHRILTTLIVPPDTAVTLPGATLIFAIPLQARPGWRRFGFDTDVSAIGAVISAAAAQGGTFEHAYDY